MSIHSVNDETEIIARTNRRNGQIRSALEIKADPKSRLCAKSPIGNNSDSRSR